MKSSLALDYVCERNCVRAEGVLSSSGSDSAIMVSHLCPR